MYLWHVRAVESLHWSKFLQLQGEEGRSSFPFFISNNFKNNLQDWKNVLSLTCQTNQKPSDMTTQVTIESELKRRMDLVEDPKFREIAIEAAKKMGITAEEWNANRAGLLLMFANEICSLENKQK